MCLQIEHPETDVYKCFANVCKVFDKFKPKCRVLSYSNLHAIYSAQGRAASCPLFHFTETGTIAVKASWNSLNGYLFVRVLD